MRTGPLASLHLPRFLCGASGGLEVLSGGDPAQIASSAAGPQVGWRESLGSDLCFAHNLSPGVRFLWRPVASLGAGEMRTAVSSCAMGGHRLAGVVFSTQPTASLWDPGWDLF